MEKLIVEQVPAWMNHRWLRHGFSTRAHGATTVYRGRTLNLGFTRDDEPGIVLENRRRFLEAVTEPREAANSARLGVIKQVHGADVVTICGDLPDLPEADGMLTREPGVMLGIQVADCVPVLMADTRRRVVGAFHAGWRGTVAGIVGIGVARMRAEYGTDPGDLVAAVGPSIRACCYVVGEELQAQFGGAFRYAAELFSGEARDHLDLAEANRRQLVDAGLHPDAVTVLDACTACARFADGSRKYFSHRAEHGVTGRAMGMIGVAHR